MKKFRRAMSLTLSLVILLTMFTAASVNIVSAASKAVVSTFVNYENASKNLYIYKTEGVPEGIKHGFGESVGTYSFDETEKALSLQKGAQKYNGGYYLFHVMTKPYKLTDQSWMIVKYKTNATTKASLVIQSNATASKFTLASDITVSNSEYVFTSPVNVNSGTDGDVFARLKSGLHCALYTTLPETTPDDVYFYIKEIAFFSSEADAKTYIETGVIPENEEDFAESAPVNGQFTGGSYTYDDFTIQTSLYLPKNYSPDKEYGLLVYFHNAGMRNMTPLYTSGTGNDLTKNIIAKSGDEFIIFAPRCPKEPYQWVQQSWAPGTYSYADTKTSDAMRTVISYIYDEIIAKYSIDMSRIIAAGDSMGGGGTWDIILREPDLFAAALPTAGYCDPTQAANISESVAIWAVHTMQDGVVKVTGDRAMTATLKNLGRTNVNYTEYDTSDEATKAKFKNAWNESSYWEHYAWYAAYSDTEMIEWLLAQRKQESLAPEITSKFTDVAQTDTYCKAVNYVTEKGLFYGMSDTEFDPSNSMTRAQFVTVLGRYAGVDTSEYTDVSFTDVDPVWGSWYAPYVEWATRNGIIQGMGDGTFGVNRSINIEQACTILARFLEYESAPNDTQLTLDLYSDQVVISDWATESMQWAIANSVYMGNMGANMTLHPANPASRSLIATMFYNITMIYGR